MLAVIVNTGTVLLGSGIGLLLKKGIPKAWTDMIMKALGLCVIYIGITSALEGENTLVLILSMVIAAIIGTGLDFDGKLNRCAFRLETRFQNRDERISIAAGFVTASLLFCVGAMTVIGSLQAGLTGDYEMLLTKSCLDLVSSAVLAASLGIGVLFAAFFVFVFQGALVLGAGLLSPVLSDPVIAEMTSAGGLLILALGLNLTSIGNFKVMNYILAIFLPIGLLPLYNLIASII